MCENGAVRDLTNEDKTSLKFHHASPPAHPGQCRYTLWITFRRYRWDQSFMQTWVRGRAVRIRRNVEGKDGYVAAFTDRSFLRVPKFIDFHFTRHTELYVRFKVLPKRSKGADEPDVEVLISNDSDPEKATLFLGYDYSGQRVVARVRLRGGRSFSFRFDAPIDQWIEAKLDLFSEPGVMSLTGTVNDFPVTVDRKGYKRRIRAAGVMSHSQPLYVGNFPVPKSHRKALPFNGLMDLVSLLCCQ